MPSQMVIQKTGLTGADCIGNGADETRDLLVCPSLWFNLDPDTDFNSAGFTDVLDLLTYLSLWFEGC
jgi:hypothetical protein